MRNRLYFLLALTFYCLSICNLDAKSAVKKVTYFGHEYKGEVVDNAPKGHGTMLFNGFTIEGTFSGNEVTDAHITVGDFEVGYEGTLTYNESQKVILQAGGALTADVYEYASIPNSKMKHNVVVEFPLRKETKTIEKVLEEMVVGADYFNVDKFTWYLPIDLSKNSVVPKELNPPVLMKPITVTQKIRIKYPEEYLESDGTITIWKHWNDGEKADFEYPVSSKEKGVKKYYYSYSSYYYIKKCSNPKTKTIFVYDPKCTEESYAHGVVNEMGNAFGDKDEQGRVWYCDENRYHVTYPNGDYCSGNRSDSLCACRVTHPNNVVIEHDFRNSRTVHYNIYDKDNNLQAHFEQSNGYANDNKYLSKLFLDILNGTCDALPRLSLCDYPRIDLHCESFTSEQICDLLKNDIFPRFDIERDEEGLYKCAKAQDHTYKFPKKMLDYGRYIEMSFTGGHGVYFVDKDQYYSTKEISNLKYAEQEAEREKANAENEAYIASRIAPLKKAFGVNPFDYNLGKVLKAGASFKDLQKYFELSVEAYKKAWGITDRYYYFSLYQDHGSSKCYEFGYGKWLSSGNELGHVWVKNGKVSSVTWY